MEKPMNLTTMMMCLTLLVTWAPGAQAQTGPRITPQTYAASLGRGLDVDWLKNSDGWRHYNENVVAEFKRKGLSHVRVRIRDDPDAALLRRLDQVVTDCTRHGLIPVIAYQADTFKNRADEKSMAKAVGWWQTVAQHGKNYPSTVSFDLVIEVSDALNQLPQTLNRYLDQATTAIRRSNPERIVIISPRVRSAPEYLSDITIPAKHNGQLMAEFHFYAAGPSRTEAAKLWTTGTAAERKIIIDKIATAKRWSEQHKIPTWVGAWMPGNYNKGNDYTLEEQRRFARFVVCELDKAQIPFSVNSDTKFFDGARGRWIHAMLPLLDDILSTKPC